MPIPVVSHVEPDAGDPVHGVFISYSHKDSKLAQSFFGALCVLIEAQADLKLSRQRVFFDRARLKAGEYWDESLQRALESSQIFIFLVSLSSLTSVYCREKELAVAVSRGMKILPVVLEEVGSWATIPAGKDALAKARCLGDFGALPKDQAFSLRPISQWRKRDAAWSAVTTGIAAALRGDPTAMYAQAPAPAAPESAPQPAQFLPFLCDRSDPITRFKARIQSRAERALLLVVKGIPQDAASKFWQRLRLEYLCSDAENRGLKCAPVKPLLDLPSPEYVLEDRASAEPLVLSSLLTTLLGRAPAESTVDSLEAALQGGAGLMPVYATLRPGSTDAQGAIVTALARSLEQCANRSALSRLAVCLAIEQQDLFTRRLVEDWKLTELKNTLIIELGPLPLVESHDVRDWYQSRQIDDNYGISEDAILEAVGTDPLRMAAFRERVAPLLGLSR